MLEDEDGELLLDEPAPDGEVLEPLAALPPLLLGGVPEALELLDEPPEAGALGEALDEEPVLSAVEPGDTEPEAEPEAEPDGEVEDEPDGEVLEPADDDDPAEPGALAPVLLAESPQAVAPSARDIAAARMESLIDASVVGVPSSAARFGPASFRH